jgi:hypothetical protein
MRNSPRQCGSCEEKFAYCREWEYTLGMVWRRGHFGTGCPEVAGSKPCQSAIRKERRLFVWLKCMSNKKVLIMIAIFIALIPISIWWDWSISYRPEYAGEHPELFSVAVNSILGAEGYGTSEIQHPPELIVQEEDSYGRTLFFYAEMKAISTYNLVICQKSNSEFAYFYPDYNFISSQNRTFSNEEIEALKIKNDWGKELSEKKCIKVDIVREKEVKSIEFNALREMYRDTLGDDAFPFDDSYVSSFITDDYRRCIYIGYGKYGERDHPSVAIMMLNPDGTCDPEAGAMELTDLYEYQDTLLDFKERNGWNEELTA